MGIEAHILLGRVNPPKAPADASKETGPGLVVVGLPQYAYEDIEFEGLPDHIEINRQSTLFSFLADVRTKVRPMQPVLERQKQTRLFFEWCDREEKNKHPTPKGYYDHSPYGSEFADRHSLGDHGHILYAVKELVEFDYDQIAELYDQKSSLMTPVYYRPENGETYREMFQESYFNMLTYCQEQGWQFIIFGFF